MSEALMRSHQTPEARFFDHMHLAVDVLLGSCGRRGPFTHRPHRAAFYHNVARSFHCGNCTPTVELVNESLITACELACYEQAMLVLARRFRRPRRRRSRPLALEGGRR